MRIAQCHNLAIEQEGRHGDHARRPNSARDVEVNHDDLQRSEPLRSRAPELNGFGAQRTVGRDNHLQQGHGHATLLTSGRYLPGPPPSVIETTAGAIVAPALLHLAQWEE